MVKDHSSSLLLDSVNDTTISPNTEVRNPSVIVDSFIYFPHIINHPNISCISPVLYMPTGFSDQSTAFAHIYYLCSILLVTH